MSTLRVETGGRVRGRAELGLSQSFAPGAHAEVEKALEDVKRLSVTRLRTELSWAAFATREGEAWYGWLLPRLSREVELLVTLRRTPPALGLEAREAAPPREPRAFVSFVERLAQRWGKSIHALELWSEPGAPASYDWRLDPGWHTYSAMVRGAALAARAAGVRTVLGAMRPPDPLLLGLLCEKGVVGAVDAVGVSAFPGSEEGPWEGWSAALAPVHATLARHGVRPEVWVTATGHSTWRHDERGQVEAFLAAVAAPASRVYWHEVRDAQEEDERQDPRLTRLGLRAHDGTPTLLLRLWTAGGLAEVERAKALWARGPRRRGGPSERPTVIFGGAGFIGSNVAHRTLEQGRRVRIFDNLSRPGVELNLRWLKELHGERLEVEVGDLRDARAVQRAVEGAAEVFHFGAQVAVTTSLTGPVHDFEVNGRGTLHVLEAVRAQEEPPSLVFTSTNKVYGGLTHLTFGKEGRRYLPHDARVRERGISEDCPLGFESPYGCSKGAADQYVLDYARSYGLKACVFRMSCIYGPRQFGTEDQGWVAHFLIRALAGQPITLYGDGMQVRDVLYVDDLVRAFQLAQANMDRVAGRAFNIGGGPGRTVSLLELLEEIARLTGERPQVRFEDWRVGDQRYYVSDTRRFEEAVGWRPEVGVREGVRRLLGWLRQMRGETVEVAEEAAGGDALEALAH